MLVTDIVDSTLATAGLDNDSVADLWREHDRCARDLLMHWNGREIDKSDGFLLLFDDAAAAAGYVAAYHAALRGLTPSLRARAGLHVGVVRLRANPHEHVERGAKPLEVDGLAKTVAARAMAVALGGQTLITSAARAQIGEARCRSHGHWRLKGLDEPVELFEVGDDSAPWTPPQESSKAYRVVPAGEQWMPASAIGHSMPAERDTFVGRRDELQAIVKLFDAGARLVSVLGVGGSGKTRLAQRYALVWLGDYRGGAWFCDLAQASDEAGIAQAVARGLELDLHGADPMALIAAAIAGRGECLVVFDNFEHLARCAEATLGRWLERAPQARFIATSRERLRIAGEQVLLLDPMPVADAARLFELRALAAGVGNAAWSDAEQAIASLMELLDGLPLAIELAAARAPVIPPARLLARMGERFNLLISQGRPLNRQATLRATLDWSWDLLSTQERSALAQASVFEGGASMAAMEAVIAFDPPVAGASVLDVAQSLVEKSLVRSATGDRFSLLRTVREYAAERLGREPTLLARARHRHARFYAALGPHGAVAQRCIELDNIVSAVRHAVSLRDAPTASSALEAAWEALRLRGPFGLALELAQEAAAIVGADHLSAARVGLVIGWVKQADGHGDQARSRFDQALTAARRAGDRRVEGQIRRLLGELDVHE
ncbi:MAG TPA: hypothetical protein VFZ28_10385, partial [Burkholderiaceae bacterium]|nr:hypothetical protein [Burkholderiaceae bacterium]